MPAPQPSPLFELLVEPVEDLADVLLLEEDGVHVAGAREDAQGHLVGAEPVGQRLGEPPRLAHGRGAVGGAVFDQHRRVV